jgi:alpha-tubulin suppressor-like RCC1 family protein
VTTGTRPAWVARQPTTGTYTSLTAQALSHPSQTLTPLLLTSPGNIPSPVTDLDDLPTGPITKLAAGGYILAALTAGNDLYCWGQAGRSPGSVTLDDNLTDAPSPVLIDDDKDVLDVAVGETHMIVLTADRAVYVLGDNANGQLGLPGVSVAKTWTCVDLDAVLGKGEIVTGVAAGPKSSFLIVHKQPEKCQ